MLVGVGVIVVAVLVVVGVVLVGTEVVVPPGLLYRWFRLEKG